MRTLTAEEREILDGMFAKAALPGYDAALDTTEEERRIAARYLLDCLRELGRLGVRAQLVVGGEGGEAREVG
ncbi:MAG TPA: hypothetical protein VNL77_21265 [Roseiflexaceae bacterium]|nr:hypothetical protein [Roseiflexaceae bacterium]